MRKTALQLEKQVNHTIKKTLARELQKVSAKDLFLRELELHTSLEGCVYKVFYADPQLGASLYQQLSYEPLDGFWYKTLVEYIAVYYQERGYKVSYHNLRGGQVGMFVSRYGV